VGKNLAFECSLIKLFTQAHWTQ